MVPTNKAGKGFNDVLEFLNQKPEKVIALIKKKRRKIDKWFAAFFENITEIHSRLGPYSPGLDIGCQDWINDLLGFIDAYTDKCKDFDKERQCHCSNPQNCREKFTKILETFCSDCQGNGGECHKQIVDYIHLRFPDTVGQEPIRNNYTDNCLLYLSWITFSNVSLEQRKKLIDRDDKRRYYDGLRKKIKNRFSLLRIDFTNVDTYSKDSWFLQNLRTHYTNFYNEELPVRQSFRDYELFVVGLASLYYQFFWDLLNDKILRDAPSEYTVDLATRDMEDAKMIAAYNLSTQNTGFDIDEWLNQIPEGFDINFEEKYHFLFNREEITGEQLFGFLDSIIKIIRSPDIGNADKPSDFIEKKISNYVKYKIFLTHRIRRDASEGLNRIPFQHKAKEDRYHSYKMFMSLYSTVTSLKNTSLRKKKSYFNKVALIDFCVEVKKGEPLGSSYYEVFDQLSGKDKVSSSHWHNLINEWKPEHPKYDKGKSPNDKDNKVKSLIVGSTDNENQRWADKLEKLLRPTNPAV